MARLAWESRSPFLIYYNFPCPTGLETSARLDCSWASITERLKLIVSIGFLYGFRNRLSWSQKEGMVWMLFFYLLSSGVVSILIDLPSPGCSLVFGIWFQLLLFYIVTAPYFMVSF